MLLLVFIHHFWISSYIWCKAAKSGCLHNTLLRAFLVNVAFMTKWGPGSYIWLKTGRETCDCTVETVSAVCVTGWCWSLLLGNCVVIKPSEVSAATDSLIAELIPKYLCQVKQLFIKDCFNCLFLVFVSGQTNKFSYNPKFLIPVQCCETKNFPPGDKKV